MKYVALLSGGKDSCYNLVHCAQNGHDLVAAASLRPESGKEELDSYMYQTVGQDAIHFVAQALEVPLYRQVIKGAALEQGSEYGGRDAGNAGGIAGDETEDLYQLLLQVKENHRDVQGVSVGAILSNYQRVRVEHVCRRLELTPLCYLWQRNQAELLDEMIGAGLEAILIKVAGIGLTKAHLGKTMAQMQPTLTKLNTLYGSHICGEGGEYESLTLDCPLFKHRIIITETETIIHSDNDFATVAFLRIKGARLEAKSPDIIKDIFTPPPLVDKNFELVQSAVEQSQEEVSNVSPSFVNLSLKHPEASVPLSRRIGNWIGVSGIQAQQNAGLVLKDEIKECFHLLNDQLSKHSLQLSNCTIINIFISSMDIFLQVNAIYSTFFGVSPPARACVGVDILDGVRVRLEAIAFVEHTPIDRHALHVQGLSYWAPANIGPYSQAILARLAGEKIFISGQIGMIPSQLALPSPSSLSMEVALSCQHVSRVSSALAENTGGDWIGHTQLCIYWLARQGDLHHVRSGNDGLEAAKVEPTIYITVKELPKGALVEKQVLQHTGRVRILDDDGSEIVEHRKPQFEQGLWSFYGTAIRWETSIMEDGSAGSVVFLKGDLNNQPSRSQTVKSALSAQLRTTISVRMLYRQTPAAFLRKLYGDDKVPITEIPCRFIASRNEDFWDAALCIISTTPR
ncbi:hypothetical protein CPB83DRAFT_803923 [Crepidotus variabilis]|uniref:Diphthine--ammonia ligase n=1 Tax=Crepidotus variabilis TaxID=179855 RepID=A0A9P6ESG5_9AGAR|nr:hypothetical protein CPB83DRAFT_803923 [Crepidotus variabilis]